MIKKTKTDRFELRMTEDQKTKLQSLAILNGKTLTQYILDSSLSTNLDTAKMDFYLNISSNLTYLKRTTYVMTKLMMLVATKLYEDQDVVLEFCKNATEAAEKHFKVGVE